MRTLARANFCLWLEAEVAASRFDFRYALNTGHPDANVGFPPIYFRLSPSSRRAERYRVLVTIDPHATFGKLVELPPPIR